MRKSLPGPSNTARPSHFDIQRTLEMGYGLLSKTQSPRTHLELSESPQTGPASEFTCDNPAGEGESIDTKISVMPEEATHPFPTTDTSILCSLYYVRKSYHQRGRLTFK